MIDFIRNSIALRQQRGKTASYVLNVDSEWGGGKSFFLKRLAEQLRAERHVVAEVNSWRDDHSDDPLVALMAEIDKALKPLFAKKNKIEAAWSAVKADGAKIAGRALLSAGKTALRRYVGAELDELMAEEGIESNSTSGEVIGEAINAVGKELETLTDKTADALIAKFAAASRSIDSFRKNMSHLVGALSQSEFKAPLFVLVDELDRCRPSYAVASLERVKHLFETNGVAFVFATDTAQLQHTIRGAYGGEFDGRAYLDRFFDRRYSFETPNLQRFVRERLAGFDSSKVTSFGDDWQRIVVSCFEAQKISSLRTIGRILDIVETTVLAWRYPEKIELCSLLFLSSCYEQTHEFDVRFAQHFLGAWVIQDRTKTQPAFIDLANVAGTVIQKARNLREAVTPPHNQRDVSLNHDPVEEYIISVFAPEFNRKNPGFGAPSVQSELPALIRCAGRTTGQR